MNQNRSLQVGVDKGWFEDEGLKVSAYSGGGGGNTMRVVMCGDADMATTAPARRSVKDAKLGFSSAGSSTELSLLVVGVVLSEFFATQPGLGRVVLQASGYGVYPQMVATIMLLIVVSFTISIVLWRWEKRFR